LLYHKKSHRDQLLMRVKGLIILLYTMLCLGHLQAQDNATNPVIVQVSGLVVKGDSLYGIPGVHVYLPRSGRGTTTNYVGFFSLPVQAGDSLIIASMGYKIKKYTIPDTTREKLSLIVELLEDTLILPEIEVFPWPTEQLFKQAFLSLKLPEQEVNNMNQNLNEQVLKRMLYTTSADGSENHRYYMQKQMQANNMKGVMVSPQMVFFNPFAWSRFIKDVKGGGLKKSTFKDRDFNEEEEE
jgi:hypothetical protein